MKIKVVLVILAVAAAGLAIALFATKKQADDQHATDVKDINDFSNQVVDANEHLKEASQVNLTLSNDLAASQQQLALSAEELTQLSNHLATANAALADIKTTLADTKTSLATEQEMVTNLNLRIADLEAQNKALDLQAEALSKAMAQLTVQIEETKNQLAVSETNSAYLQGELQKQLAQKAELEHRFNDVDELRAQVRKLKDEMFVARRVQMMKSDNGNKKGGQLLMMRNPPAASAPARNPSATNYDLNVEIGSDGSMKVIPPVTNTNPPAH